MPKPPIDGQAFRELREKARSQPTAAEVSAEVQTEWQGGSVSVSRVYRWRRRETDRAPERWVAHSVLADEPLNFLGTDTAPKPTELALSALGACLAVGVAYNAALRGISLDRLEIRLEARMSRLPFLGLDERTRPGFQAVEVEIALDSPAPAEEVRNLLDHVKRTSPVGDLFANPVPLSFRHRLNGEGFD